MYKLKALWEELNNFRLVCTCGHYTCGGVNGLSTFVQYEYVMSFLMGLNDSFSQIHGQLLLLDPLPPINKFFSLVAQEERQHNISSGEADSVSGVAFALRSETPKKSERHALDSSHYRGNYRGQKKERPFCTHCNFHGHTIDRCYKLHGYPPGYKTKPRTPNASAPVAMASANQASDQQVDTKDS